MAAGARLAHALEPGMVIGLSGELGAGKTTLVRGLLRELGWKGPVKSPTYALVEHYEFSSLYLYHFDLFRITGSVEWGDLGFDEYLRPDSVCIIEWPERLGDNALPIDLALRLEVSAPGRRLQASAMTARAEPAVRSMEDSA
jgi:tRNA threonylcarbamoyladenosine biosynthesis protein TsaE